jgi:hypothetical protein
MFTLVSGVERLVLPWYFETRRERRDVRPANVPPPAGTQ